MTILVVEDDLASLQVRAGLLHVHGYDVRLAPTGARALEEFDKGGVDVIVLDLGLPDIDGEVVLHQIRAMQPDARIVVLTGRVHVPDSVLAEATEVVIKGSGVQLLLDAIAPPEK